MDKQKLLNTKVAYPTGQNFYDEIKAVINKIGYNIKMFPQITARNMNHDQQLYVSLVSLFSLMIGRMQNKQDIVKIVRVLKSEDMMALKDDTFGTYFENGARARLYQFIMQF